MRYVHFSAEPVTRIESREQTGKFAERGDKPNGLWFSVEGGGDGWRDWCKSERFALGKLLYETEIVFTPGAKVLHIGSDDALDAFHEMYKIIPAWAEGYLHVRYGIDWAAVARLYDAIVIAPYLWERRLSDHAFWYYGWDCASGCVWNAAAVTLGESVRASETTP